MIEINRLIDVFTKENVIIEDIRWWVRQPGEFHYGYKTPYYTFVIPIKGKARFVFNHQPYELEAGKILHCMPNMGLDKDVLGDSTWEYCTIHYSLGSNVIMDTIKEVYKIEVGENYKITEKLRNLYKIHKQPGSLSAFRTKQLFYDLLEETFTRYRINANKNSHTTMKEALEYIHNHYVEPLSLEQMANRCQMKPEQFSYFFYKYTGIRPNQYLIMHRMKIAETLLKEGNCKISDVAESVGYHDAYYFSRLFKKYKGKSPNVIKKASKDKPL
ncbi:AraC family transcriptional regulator [Natranaerovirga hydrolytica]|uniref:AraC family transcriptional regulator n=1 Tax=Natranaerovirga hydrolytica TaxID=680378 RepID=A0A4R1MKH7_9FIRM|nr:AraC family transcriptional regulator [Natranaerovirga hydrolytica]TCK93328.1 AraC family transcriptional regulator [Natranaerovirga hydrolytica]